MVSATETSPVTYRLTIYLLKSCYRELNSKEADLVKWKEWSQVAKDDKVALYQRIDALQKDLAQTHAYNLL